MGNGALGAGPRAGPGGGGGPGRWSATRGAGGPAGAGRSKVGPRMVDKDETYYMYNNHFHRIGKEDLL